MTMRYLLTLYVISLTQSTSLLGVDHQDLMRVVKLFGAKEEYLDQNWRVEPVTRETRSERLIRK